MTTTNNKCLKERNFDNPFVSRTLIFFSSSRTQQYNALQYVAVDLDSKSDPALAHRCAKFFMENKQYDKAVDLLAVGKKVIFNSDGLGSIYVSYILLSA